MPGLVFHFIVSHDLQVQFFFPYLPGIILTGSGGREGERSKSVEILRSDGTPLCSLPDLPYDLWGHTQNGLTTCGGTNGNIRRRCYTFDPKTGTWEISHNLNEERFYHNSWETPRGIVLIGGTGLKSTELLVASEKPQLNPFEMKYESR